MKSVDVDTDSSELSASTAATPRYHILRLPMLKELSMTMREEEGRRQESSEEKQERGRRSNSG